MEQGGGPLLRHRLGLLVLVGFPTTNLTPPLLQAHGAPLHKLALSVAVGGAGVVLGQPPDRLPRRPGMSGTLAGFENACCYGS